MNATKRSAARAGLVFWSLLAAALTGCRTHVVHERTRTVYVPTPPQVVHVPPAPAPQPPPRVVYVPAAAPQPPPPVVVVAPPAHPSVVVIQSENDFYEPLAAYGRWVVVGPYGRCWIPARVETGWRPYANGHWQRTDAGWYWVSEEPWGWATYHYGRWDYHSQFGWLWVPHTQWAPAWVAWREGGGYVGWAPLRPSVAFGVNLGVTDYEPAFATRAFVFVEHRRMLEPIRPRTVIVNNTTIINQTVNITNVKVVDKTVINEGPRPEVIERASGRRVQSVPVREFRRKDEATVAARQRNLPTANDRKVEPPARSTPQTVEQKPVTPPVTRPVERPAQVVTQPPRPLVTPVRPTPSRPETQRPTRDEKKPENEIERRVTTTPPAVAPKAKAEVNPPQVAPPRRDVRLVEKPAMVTRPTPQPVTANPVRETVKQPPGRTARATAPIRSEAESAARAEMKRETTIEKKNPATPPAVAPKTRPEARPEIRPETNRSVRVEPAPAAVVKGRPAPPSEDPAEKRTLAPREISRAAQQTETNKPGREVNGPEQQGGAQATTNRPTPTRAAR